MNIQYTLYIIYYVEMYIQYTLYIIYYVEMYKCKGMCTLYTVLSTVHLITYHIPGVLYVLY